MTILGSMSTPIFNRSSVRLPIPVEPLYTSILSRAIFAILTALAVCGDCYGAYSDFSTTEQAYVKQNPSWVVGYVDIGLNKDKMSDSYNYGNELLSKIANNLNVTLNFKKYSSASSLYSALCDKSVDVVVDAPKIDSDLDCMTLSDSYFKIPAILLGSKNIVEHLSIDKLRDLKVAIVEGDTTEEWLKILHPNTSFLTTKDLSSAISLINSEAASVIVEDGMGSYPILPTLLALPLTARAIPNVETNLHFAVRKEDSLLMSVLNKALRGLPANEIDTLKSYWMAHDDPSSTMLLSDEEKRYLSNLPTLKVAYDPNWKPIAFADSQGGADGLSADYWREVTSALSLKTENAPTHSWKDALFKMASGQVDIILPVVHAESNQVKVLYTRPFIKLSNVIVTSGARVSRLSELNGKSVAITDPLFLRDQLKALVPYSSVEIVDSTFLGMKKVVDGEAFAFIGNLSIINSLMNEKFSGDLQIVAPVDISDDLSIGVTENYKKLLPLINRALRTIPEERRKEINNKWLHITPQPGLSWIALTKLLWFSAFLILTIMALLFIFYRRLQKEIHHRRNAEQTIVDQLQLREALIETFPYPVVVKDIEKRYLLINHAYEHAFSIKKSELLGRTTLETYHYPGDWSVTIDELATQVMRKRESFHSEFTMSDEQGGVRTWLYWMKPFYRADLTLAGVMVSLVDITHIRQVDERSKSLEARLKRITTHLSVGVFEALHERGQLPVFTYLAGSIKELLGLDITDVLDNSLLLFDAIHPEDLTSLLAELERKAVNLQPLRAFFRCRAIGREMHVRVDAVPESTPSGTITWNGVWVDVTESRQKSIKLSKAKEAAEEAANAKSQFLATMSHEIRTPMNGILGLLELLHSKSMSRDQQQIMQMIDESAKSLMTVLNDVLDLSKIEFNQLQLHNQKTDLRTLLSSVMGVMAHQAHAKGLRVRVSISPMLAHTINVDDMRLRQVLLNLLSNAIKFTAIGTITLKVAVTLSNPDSQRIIISVSDTGPGMDNSQKERIFKPFTQGDTSITRRYGGTGLGLVISQHLVELMGGELSLDSEVGVGTRVAIMLPVGTFSRDGREKLLLGRRVCVDLSDDEDREELTHLLSTLGATSVLGAEEQIADSCDIYFFDDIKKLERKHHDHCVNVTATPILSGWQDTGLGYPALTSNPFMWSSVVYVCNELLGCSVNNVINGPLAEVAGRPLILVAEDHPTNQALIKSQLDRLGFDCEIAANGSEALHQFKESTHCMLITDCYMPIMDGYTLAQKVRSKLKGSQHFPILAMTASVLIEEKQRCIDAGIDECLLKPLGLETLRQAMNKWLPGSKITSVSTQCLTGEPSEWLSLLELLDECPELTDLIPSFIESSESDLNYIEKLLIQQDKQKLHEQLHRLRGALRIFSLTELSRRSEEIEREIEKNSTVLISDSLIEFIKEVRIMLDKMRGLA
ncbi:ATP-binding protein [Pseudomonas sp. AMR01]|uniref:ATP-binding protein n=1 Tax=Pseudomonas sp. AMR01 TaxID=3064904 RepID=UPI0035C1F8EF